MFSNPAGQNRRHRGAPGLLSAPTCLTVAIISSNVKFSNDTPFTLNNSSPRTIMPVFSAGRYPPFNGCFLNEPATAGRPSIGDSRRSPRPKSGCGVTMTSYSCRVSTSSLSSLPLGCWSNSALLPPTDAAPLIGSTVGVAGSREAHGGGISKISIVPDWVKATIRGGPPKLSSGHQKIATIVSFCNAPATLGMCKGGKAKGTGTTLTSSKTRGDAG